MPSTCSQLTPFPGTLKSLAIQLYFRVRPECVLLQIGVHLTLNVGL
jgi:hypothetical protein